jgi:GH15 family glucan-1,4-alpha-glucosidase
VKDNWKSEGFDLWEEVKSTDFYFNRMAYVYSLNVAADFGDMIGKTEAAEYRALAETIRVIAKYINIHSPGYK